MASRQEMADFLESVERRAFRQAVYAVRNEDAALDIIQDAMLRLAQRYGDKPAAELPMLFQRILQNAITDHFRREKVRNLWTTLFSALSPGGDSEESNEHDVLETIQAPAVGEVFETGAERVERTQVLAIIEQELERLPARQREAFLMRYWHDMDVAETALAMGCSEGSVKTHCSRATHTLAAALQARGITL
jgi:RNA polymerase sigma-70 factor (ECF subfamily)